MCFKIPMYLVLIWERDVKIHSDALGSPSIIVDYYAHPLPGSYLSSQTIFLRIILAEVTEGSWIPIFCTLGLLLNEVV